MRTLFGKTLCFIGVHRYVCMLKDFIDEFGFIPNDDRMPKVAECERCGVKFGK